MDAETKQLIAKIREIADSPEAKKHLISSEILTLNKAARLIGNLNWITQAGKEA